jgi:hypothetical protein
MEPEGSLLCSQVHATGPCPESDESCFSKITSNIILPCTRRSSESSLRFLFTDQNFVSISHLPMRATYPAHLTILNLITLIS